MQSFRKLFLIAGCLALAGGTVAQAQKEKGKPRDKGKMETKKKGDKDKSPEDKAEKEKEARRMPFPLPIGHGGKGLAIPYLDGAARKTMNFSVGTAQRIDADRVDLGDTKIETFNEDAQPEMTIDLPVSQINLTTRVITSAKPVQIKRSDFQLTGDGMEFDTLSKQGTVKGNVRMLIYNLANETEPDAPAKPKEEPKPSE